MLKTYQQKIGDIGEQAVSDALSQRGWSVKNLNEIKRNHPNCDLKINKGTKQLYLEVKTCNLHKWISAGSVNPAVCSGGPIFNRKKQLPKADFVICLTPMTDSKKNVSADWRFFILPVAIAEQEFRKNIDAYFNGLKHDGTPRSKKGACQDFVGPGKCTSKQIPDHQDDYLWYEGRFDLLG